jgi:pyridoxal phosphate enzyme (YggS family)
VTRITKHLVNLQDRISRACADSGRKVNDVSILAVSKRHGVDAIHEAHHAGLRAMGENYLQEALQKMPDCPADIVWHFIGRVQANKTRAIAEQFDWVQTVSTERIARRLSEQRPATLPPLNICVQISTAPAGAHDGVAPDAAPQLCAIVAELPRLRLRGLMTIPLQTQGLDAQRVPLRECREVFAALQAEFELDTLSMGMSADLEAAVREGSTLLRIGTDLFGARPE